jgi:PAS domain S-box-containing protein
MFGATREEIIGKTPFEFSTAAQPNGRPSREAGVRRIRAVLAGEPQFFEWKHCRLDGTPFDAEVTLNRVDLGGEPLVLGIVRDVSERKRADAALRESTKRLLRAQRVAQMGFLDWDLKTNEMYWSDQIYDLYGIDRQQNMANIDLIMELVHPDDREFVEENLETATSGVKEYDIDHRVVRPDGNVIWVHAQAELVRDADGAAESLLGTVVDITDRKRAEQERGRLETQLHQAQKMEAVGQLAGGVAHDFNNILTVILGHAELLLSTAKGGPDEQFTNVVKSGLEGIKFAGHRAAALTRQLLAFGRREMASVEVLDLGPVIRDAEKLVRQMLREDIVFDVDVASDIRRIRADAGQFEQVMMNLVVNARDAMPKGGTLTVTCANADLNEAHAAGHIGAKPGPHVMLAVSDSGVGMSNDTMERMFEPFFTTKPIGKGTGLGLTTVYEIVKQAGAHISVESKLAKGSTFTVYFPAAEEEVAEAETVASYDRQSGDEVILVCEDEEDVRRVASQGLRMGGYTVLEAVNGKHALDVAADYSGKIDLLLSDVVMPEMNGKDLAEAMAGSYPEMRVLFVSGYTDDVVDGKVTRSEGTDFLQKPFSPTVLLKRVRELLDKTYP